MQMNSPLMSHLMTARIHKAMSARIEWAAHESERGESRRLDRELAQMHGDWADESNVGAVLNLLLDDYERTRSSSPGAVVPSASATTTPRLEVIEVIAEGLAPASTPAAPPATAARSQQEASQPEVEGVLSRL
jgi:hypothetical protein